MSARPRRRRHGHARLDFQLDAVHGDSGDDRCLDDLGIDTHLHGVEHVAPCKVDGSRALKRQGNLRAVCGNQGVDDLVDVAARKVMRFELIDLHVKPRLVRLDERHDDLAGRHAAHAHTDERDDVHGNVRRNRRNPKPDGHEMQEHHDDEDSDDEEKCQCYDAFHKKLLLAKV